MDLTMRVASLSVSLQQSRTQQELSLAVMKEAMTAAGQGMEELLASTEMVSLDPNLGAMVDVQV